MTTDLFSTVNAIPVDRVVEVLGIPPAKKAGRHKYPCAACESSDAMNCDPGRGGGAKCFSCGRHFTNIDLACFVAGRSLDGNDALQSARELAAAFAIDDTGNRPPEWKPRASSSPPEPGDDPEAVESATAILGFVWERLTLRGDAPDYLRRRGIDPTVAFREGVRSVRRDEWVRILAEYDDDALTDAGLRHRERHFYQPFWYRRCPFLVFPFHGAETGRLTSLRFRRIVDDDSPKALGLLSGAVENLHRPPLPFGAPGAICQAMKANRPLFVVEGEVDALSITSTGRHAIGAPGASNWLGEWSEGWDELEAVVVVTDGDEAGRTTLAGSVMKSAARRFGMGWVEARLHLETFGDGLDANDLLQTGELRDALRSVEDRLGLPNPAPLYRFPSPRPEGEPDDASRQSTAPDTADADRDSAHHSSDADQGHDDPADPSTPGGEVEPPPAEGFPFDDDNPNDADSEAAKRQLSRLCEESLESLRAALAELHTLPDEGRQALRAVAYDADSGPGSEWGVRKLIFRKLHWELEDVRREHRRLHQDKSRADGSGARDAAPRKPGGRRVVESRSRSEARAW